MTRPEDKQRSCKTLLDGVRELDYAAAYDLVPIPVIQLSPRTRAMQPRCACRLFAELELEAGRAELAQDGEGPPKRAFLLRVRSELAHRTNTRSGRYGVTSRQRALARIAGLFTLSAWNCTRSKSAPFGV